MFRRVVLGEMRTYMVVKGFYVYGVCFACRDQKTVSDPLEPQGQVAVSQMWVQGLEPGSSGGAARALYSLLSTLRNANIFLKNI